MPNDILVIGFDNDGRDHNKMLQKVLQRCRKVILKSNKDKNHFRCTSATFFGDVITRNGVQPDLYKDDYGNR